MNPATKRIYVSQDGNDMWDGTEERPYATLQRAQRAARAAGKAGRPVHVCVYGGTYYLPETLRFTPEDSGTEAAPVLYEAACGQEAVLSGSLRLGLEWRPYKGGILQAETPHGLQLDQLFVNGQAMRMARYPNYSEEVRILNGYAADCIREERVRRWADPAGGYVHAMHKHLWGDYHYLIRGKDENNRLLLEGGWQNNRQMGMHDEYRYVENMIEELDAPGEWYHDSEAGMLYLFPCPETEIAKALVEGVRLAHLVEFAGSGEAPVTHIGLSGLTFKHAARTFMENKEPLLRSDWTIYRGGAVLLRGTENCSVSDCTFTHLGGNAVFVDGYNRNPLFRGCHIADVGASGIAFVGDPAAARSPLFEYHERQKLKDMDMALGPRTNQYPAGGLVEDCLICRVGRVEKQSAPVQISMSMDITVRHCSIYEAPRAGINISEGTFGGHVIEGCDVFDTVLETGDHGSFNSWGRDRYWMLEDVDPDRINQDQTAEDSPLPVLDMARPITLRNSRWRCDYGWDIDLDDGSSWYQIYNNLCLAGGIKLREGFYRICENNIMVDNTLHPHVWYRGSRDIIRHNIVFTPYAPVRVPQPWGQLCDGNLLHAPDAGEPQPASRLQEQSGSDSRSLTADALFVDPAAGNYQVCEGSPALKLGFRNFPMDEFGVRKPELRRIARTPKLPVPGAAASASGRRPQLSRWGRCKVKNVVGLGEVSAAGLPGETGVVVESLPWGSWQLESGFQVADVVLELAGGKVDTVEDLFRLYEAIEPGEPFPVILFRGQREIGLTVGKRA
ncbi:MAG: zinc metallopeptidase RseP [Paenibacillaceae bacterium]|jgi:hypothetical protein|nr:zinc metallopeptidase RseP [Paenibacillaceae bacterium]